MCSLGAFWPQNAPLLHIAGSMDAGHALTLAQRRDAGADSWICRYVFFAASPEEARARIRDAAFHDGGWTAWERLPPDYRHPPQSLAAIDPAVR